jgi:hypothetical protein
MNTILNKTKLDTKILEGIAEAEADLGEEFTQQLAIDIAGEIEQSLQDVKVTKNRPFNSTVVNELQTTLQQRLDNK